MFETPRPQPKIELAFNTKTAIDAYFKRHLLDSSVMELWRPALAILAHFSDRFEKIDPEELAHRSTEFGSLFDRLKPLSH